MLVDLAKGMAGAGWAAGDTQKDAVVCCRLVHEGDEVHRMASSRVPCQGLVFKAKVGNP